MVFPTLGLTLREQARLSAMRCTDEPLIEEMGEDLTTVLDGYEFKLFFLRL